jgi:undecaprenyl pyrophosphate phosphatase UppP
MDGNLFNGNGPMSTKKMFEIIGLACACLGCLLTFVFNIVTCARSPKASIESGDGFTLSLWVIGVIIAAILAVAGGIIAFLSKEQGQKLGMMAIIAIIVSGIALVFAIIPNATICAYNCALTDEFENLFRGFY